MSGELHPMETESETVVPFPEPKPFEVPGARITYTHQASSGRTFGFETLVEQMASREDLDQIFDTWVSAATRQQAKIELLKAEHDLRLVEKRLKLIAQDRVRKESEFRQAHERSGRRSAASDWKPSLPQQQGLANIDREVEEHKEQIETIRRSIADYTALMNGHDPSHGAANA